MGIFCNFLYIVFKFQGVCIAIMTGSFVLQVLSVKADKISNAVNCAWCGWEQPTAYPF